MKVKELIEELNKFDQDMKVIMVSDGYRPISHVKEIFSIKEGLNLPVPLKPHEYMVVDEYRDRVDLFVAIITSSIITVNNPSDLKHFSTRSCRTIRQFSYMLAAELTDDTHEKQQLAKRIERFIDMFGEPTK